MLFPFLSSYLILQKLKNLNNMTNYSWVIGLFICFLLE